MSIVEGPRGGRCLYVAPARPRQVEAQAAVAHLLAQQGVQPAVLQRDRGACFVGAEAASVALPSRLTLWLWSLGIAHRLIPPHRPQHNGAVERLHGALARSWQGEPDGLAALQAVWNVGKQPACPATRPYRGRADSQLERVWAGLARVTVTRHVSRQGTVSLWDRPVKVGRTWADRTVVLAFDAARQLLVVHDERGTLLRERPLAWLNLDWLWKGLPVTAHLAHTDDTSIAR